MPFSFFFFYDPGVRQLLLLLDIKFWRVRIIRDDFEKFMNYSFFSVYYVQDYFLFCRLLKIIFFKDKSIFKMVCSV